MAFTVAIGILTWRGYDATRDCLNSLRILSQWPIPTVVVDNHSGTGEGARLAEEFGAPVEALTLPTNGGVPLGYNAAIRWASARGASHVLLLNNDVLATDPDMISELLRAAGDDVAATGPIVCDSDGQHLLGWWFLVDEEGCRRPPEDYRRATALCSELARWVVPPRLG